MKTKVFVNTGFRQWNLHDFQNTTWIKKDKIKTATHVCRYSLFSILEKTIFQLHWIIFFCKMFKQGERPNWRNVRQFNVFWRFRPCRAQGVRTPMCFSGHLTQCVRTSDFISAWDGTTREDPSIFRRLYKKLGVRILVCISVHVGKYVKDLSVLKFRFCGH